MLTKIYPKVLTIAGSDSGGGAGIQADLKTFSALGCYGMSAITCITAQNTLGVTAIHPVPPDIVEKQIIAVLTDIGADVVKIGMVYSVQIVHVISKILKDFQVSKVVIDPVMVAASGDNLIEDNTVLTLTRELFPLATIVTPNLKETERILETKIETEEDFTGAATKMIKFGNRAVIIKGFMESESIIEDIFYDGLFDDFIMLKRKKIDTINLHGTGCTFSSAIAAFLALEYSLPDAVTNAKEYIHKSIINGRNFKTGKGHGPVNHFFRPLKLSEKLPAGYTILNKTLLT